MVLPSDETANDGWLALSCSGELAGNRSDIRTTGGEATALMARARQRITLLANSATIDIAASALTAVDADGGADRGASTGARSSNSVTSPMSRRRRRGSFCRQLTSSGLIDAGTPSQSGSLLRID